MAIFIPLVTRFDPKGLQGAQRALANFQNFAVQVGRVAAAAITAVGVASVREAVKFESTFAKIEGLVGLTRAEIVELEEAAKRLGPQFATSAADAGEALFFITSAGLRGASAVTVLEASLKGAAVGLGDAKTIADLATSAVNAYGESQLDGALAVDVLTNAVRLGKLEPEALAGSMGQVLPLASALGIGFDEVGAAMAGMSKTGTDASTASTQLRGIMNTLISPTNQANDALADMGLSAEGLREQIREKGLFSTLETLTEAFDGNIEATASVFGNVRALSGVLDLMGESTEENRILFDEMSNSLGVTDEAFDVISETTEFKFKKAMETARGSLLNIGDSILDNLLPHLDTFQDWIENNGPAIEEGFIGIFDAVHDFVTSPIMSDMMGSFRDVLPHIEDMVEALAELSSDLLPFLPGAVDFLTGAISLMADAIGGVATAAGLMNDELHEYGILSEETPTITEKNRKFFADFDAAVIKLRDRLREVINNLITISNSSVDQNRVEVGKDLGSPGQTRTDPPRAAPQRRLPVSALNPLAAAATADRRAGGGPVSAGNAFLVGEMGPELFIPSDGGNITPNDQLGGTVYNITVNAGMGAGDGAKLGEQIVSAIKRFERSSGKVFVSV